MGVSLSDTNKMPRGPWLFETESNFLFLQDDCKRAVVELDEKEYVEMQLIIIEVINHYMLILDIISKNYEKIKQPRSANNMESMY